MKKQNEHSVPKDKEYLVFAKYLKDYQIFDIRANKPICYQTDEDSSMVLQEIDTIDFSNKEKNILDYFAPNNISILLSINKKAKAFL